MTPKPISAFVLLPSWPQHGQSKHGRLIWVKGMRREKWGGCATSNAEYVRVRCALRFSPRAGPWECYALARCLVCVPDVWAFYPSVLSSPERGATGQGAAERCLWLKRCFYAYGRREKTDRKGRDGVWWNRKPWLFVWTWVWEVQKSPLPPPPALLLNTFGASRLAFKQSCRG